MMRRTLSVVAEAASNGTPNYELGGSVNHIGKLKYKKSVGKLDPVGSTVRYKMMKLCSGSGTAMVGTWWY